MNRKAGIAVAVCTASLGVSGLLRADAPLQGQTNAVDRQASTIRETRGFIFTDDAKTLAVGIKMAPQGDNTERSYILNGLADNGTNGQWLYRFGLTSYSGNGKQGVRLSYLVQRDGRGPLTSTQVDQQFNCGSNDRVELRLAINGAAVEATATNRDNGSHVDLHLGFHGPVFIGIGGNVVTNVPTSFMDSWTPYDGSQKAQNYVILSPNSERSQLFEARGPASGEPVIYYNSETPRRGLLR